MPVTQPRCDLGQLPPHWMADCKEMQTYPSGDIQDIALVHAQNMEASGICRARHNALVKRLRELEESCGN